MFYPFGPRPDQPVRVKDPRPVTRYEDDATGNAGVDGFTRLSRADRETGHSPPVGEQTSVWPRYIED
ncbi:hypothetical protein I6F35_33720 [Bradyrhizobium sp. BRP22]|uniref:hypothetical protein n=1 Tax=Bradyrhizobium sp. BRP22 TaxID=2793821 RepID=UPI001CD78698|nr:hypothetical protein [Bradyrhizobium sp. BRP22]MCA1458095.1 hypothetical protein [Bradyrhizobium sp. BRP22]